MRLGVEHAETLPVVDVQPHLVGEPFRVQAPAFGEGAARPDAREPAQRRAVGHLLLDRDLEVVAGHRLVERDARHDVQRSGRQVVAVHVVDAGALAVTRGRPVERERHVGLVEGLDQSHLARRLGEPSEVAGARPRMPRSICAFARSTRAWWESGDVLARRRLRASMRRGRVGEPERELRARRRSCWIASNRSTPSSCTSRGSSGRVVHARICEAYISSPPGSAPARPTPSRAGARRAAPAGSPASAGFTTSRTSRRRGRGLRRRRVPRASGRGSRRRRGRAVARAGSIERSTTTPGEVTPAATPSRATSAQASR